MFGFIGSGVLKIRVEDTPLHKQLSSNNRLCNIDAIGYQNSQNYGRMEFPTENPPLVVINNIESSNTGNTLIKFSNITNPTSQEDTYFGTIPAQNSTRWNFINNATNPILSPRYNTTGLRDIDFLYFKPNDVYGLRIGVNNSSLYDIGNVTSTELLEPLSGLQNFINAKGLVISNVRGSFLKEIGNLPPNLEQINLAVLSNLLTFPNLPQTLKYLMVRQINLSLPINKLLDGIQNATKLKLIIIGNDSGYPTTTIGSGFSTSGQTLNISGHTELQEFVMHLNQSTNGTGVIPTLPSHDLRAISIINNAAITTTHATQFRDNLHSGNTQLRLFSFYNCINFNPVWNLTSNDIKNSAITQFILINCPITGSIDFTDDCPNIVGYYNTPTGSGNGVNMNSIKLGGLINATLINVNNNTLLTTLELPVPTIKKLTILRIDGNTLLNVNNNINLKSQISQNVEISTLSAFNVGSLDTDFNISGLTKLTGTVNIYGSNLSGTLTLPSSRVGDGITSLNIFLNTGLTNVSNLSVHNKMALLNHNNTQLDLDITLFSGLTTLTCHSSNQSIIDFRNINNLLNKSTLASYTCNNLTHIYFPNSINYFRIGTNGDLNIYSCPNLTGITNMENVSWLSTTGNINNDLTAYNCGLNIPFQIGINQFIPRAIQIQNNGMSQTNVDTTIDNIYDNKTKWSGYTSAKSINIAGTNSTPSGTYQAPSGYIQANGTTVGNDGTPASAKEQIYVLVNQNIDNTTTKKYGWTITYTV